MRRKIKFYFSSILLLVMLGIDAFTQSVRYDTIFFDRNSYTLKQVDIEKIRSLDSTLRKSTQIVLFGRADSTNTKQYNKTLAAKRVRSVKNEIAKIVFDTLAIRTEFFGEDNPIEIGKIYKLTTNRSVIIQYDVTEPSLKRVVKREPPKHDSLPNDVYKLKSNRGTIVKVKRCTFPGVPLEDIEFTINDMFHVDEMFEQNIVTVDNNGNCLRSGGVVSFEAKLNGVPLSINPNCPVEVSLPTKKPIDGMNLYYLNADGLWNLQEKNIDASNGYYNFEMPASGTVNVDKPIENVSQSKKAFDDLLEKIFKPYRTVAVKLKTKDKNLNLAIKENGLNMIVKPQQWDLTKNTAIFPACLNPADPNQTLELVITMGKSNKSPKSIVLANLKFKKLKRVYVLYDKDIAVTITNQMADR